MSDGSQPPLSPCGCCEALPPLASETNDPGLPAIAYRLGTYAAFLRRMLSQIQSPNTLATPSPGPWVLSALTTRSPDDPAIALLDAWAVVADVLTFYQERIANEGFLRTATERQSVLQLARAIGYELGPGVAASTYLTFTVEDVIGTAVTAPLPQGPKTPSAPTQGAPTFNAGIVTIPQGTKVQSIPAQGELPQTFETSSDLQARAQWNMLLPRLTQPADLAITSDGKLHLLGLRTGSPPPSTSLPSASAYLLNPDSPPLTAPSVPAREIQQLFLTGTNTGIQVSDRLLLVGQNRNRETLALVFIVRNLVVQAAQNLTRVDFADNPAAIPFAPIQFPPGAVPATPLVFNLGNVTRYVLEKSIGESDLQALIQVSNWDPTSLATVVNNFPAPSVSEEGVFSFGAQAAFFGHNAPPWKTLTNPSKGTLRGDAFPLDWDAANQGAGRFIWTDSQGTPYADADVHLERSFPQVQVNDWTVFESPTVPTAAYQISGVAERSLADYGLSGKTTGLTLKSVGALGGVGPAAPAAVAWAANRLDVFALASDGNLYHKWWDGSHWGGPENLGGGNLVNSPAVAAWAANRLDVFAIGNDGNLYHKWWDGSNWGGPENLLGGNLVFSPSAVSWAANRLDIFALGSDGNLYHKWWGGSGWGGPENLGGNGNLTTSPSAVAWSANRLDTFLIGSVGHWMHTWWDGSRWNGPEDLGAAGLPGFLVRTTKAYLQSQQQTLAELPVTDDIPAGATSLMLNGMVLGLTPGQPLAVNGTRSDAPGVVTNEVVFLQSISHDGGFTTLEFTAGLQFGYKRNTLTLSANVVEATHGSTVAVPEILGSGSAATVNQSFTLKQSPLTYVSAPTASGSKSTLQLRVNNLLWQEVPSLYGLGPNDQEYIVRRSDGGTSTVTGGDGVTGAVFPTGQNNIAATYRVGIGTAGNVAAGSLTILQSRPPGVRGTTNPLAASGGADPENLDEARGNAPLTVLTLDRIVSVEDYENFAAAFAGIGKAQGLPLWVGEAELVHLTVAGIQGAAVDPTSQLFLSLSAAIDAARDPVQQFRVASYRPATFSLTASVIIDAPRYVAADVLAAVRTALLAAFSFDRRGFAQPVTSAEVIATIQATPGVIATTLTQLYRSEDPSGPGQTEPAPVLAAAYAHWEGGAIVPAELLLLNSTGFSVTEGNP